MRADERDVQGRAGSWLLVGAVLAAAGAAWWLAGDGLGYDELQANHRALEEWRDRNMAVAVLAFAAAYVLVVALSVPGAVWLTLVGGFLFGIVAGAAVVIVSATLGATLIFLAARTVLADPLRRRAGAWLEWIERGFRRGEASFMLVMRLIPGVPFFIANLAPALLGARTRTFVWTTFIGIMPATVVYVSIGAGLGEQLGRGERPDLGLTFQPHILVPLLGLAALAALPPVLRWAGVLRGRGDVAG